MPSLPAFHSSRALDVPVENESPVAEVAQPEEQTAEIPTSAPVDEPTAVAQADFGGELPDPVPMLPTNDPSSQPFVWHGSGGGQSWKGTGGRGAVDNGSSTPSGGFGGGGGGGPGGGGDPGSSDTPKQFAFAPLIKIDCTIQGNKDLAVCKKSDSDDSKNGDGENTTDGGNNGGGEGAGSGGDPDTGLVVKIEDVDDGDGSSDTSCVLPSKDCPTSPTNGPGTNEGSTGENGDPISVDEPGTLSLLLMGGIGLLLARRNKRKAA
jgi:hypothetical protein